MPGRAAFLDRDGIINELVYYPEQGIVDSPFTVGQLRLVEGVGDLLRGIAHGGYELILVSNQPGVAKGHFTMEVFEEMRKKMRRSLRKEGITLDGEYYCLHHPFAVLKDYRVDCDCRKPKPGNILKAAAEHGISLEQSIVIGDGLVDIKAGIDAGCWTILISNLNSLVIRLMNELGAEPDFIAGRVKDALSAVREIKKRT